jgi:predicted Zn-dependent protease
LEARPSDVEALRLLASVLGWKKDYPEAIALTQRLADMDPDDAELPVRLAELMLWSGDHEKAAARFQELLEANFDRPELWRGFVDSAASLPQLSDGQAALVVRLHEKIVNAENQDVAFLARLAWLVYRAREPAKAGALLNRALALKPRDEGVRRELAGTLAAVGRAQDALRMYEGMTLDMNDRYYLIGIHSTARRKCQELLEEDAEDKEAARETAYLNGWKKTVDESLVLYEKAVAATPQDRALRIRFAEVTLWSGAHDRAVALFQSLLDDQFEQLDLWRSYIDAAASAEAELTAPQVRLLGRIHERKATTETKVEYLSRLAWTWIRLKESPRAEKLLDRALSLSPTDSATRRELAGVLAAAGRHAQARRMYEGLKLTQTDRFRLIELDLAARRFDEADKEVQAILRLKPGNFKARMLQAAVLTGRKQFAEATRVYQELAAAHPDDASIPLKLAELALATGEYDIALARYQERLDKNVNQPAVWKSYIDAAASAKKLPEATRATAVYIHDKLRGQSTTDAVYLTRLAWVLRRVRELGRSIAALELALEHDSTSYSIRLQLAEALQENGDYAKAEKHYQILLRAKPTSPE